MDIVIGVLIDSEIFERSQRISRNVIQLILQLAGRLNWQGKTVIVLGIQKWTGMTLK